ncbi:hypothetical protein M1843_12545 [Isoptericola sp. 4D.3]|uniref:Lipoprotein n=1 Tax=Isoptericola peretonis TaxID=2918523 RepID=A0ABT0J4Z8_9MICO|nr:hypothetical protein [Isoptericola sp. 4D.3]
MLSIATTSACSTLEAAVDRTAYCRPEDPVVTPQRVAAGDELHIDVLGREDGVDCEPRMPDRARYAVSIMSEMPDSDPTMGRYSAALGVLDPSSDGAAQGTVRIPDDIPAGKAEVSLGLQGAKTLCELDHSIGCAKNPFAPIEVTD